MCCLVPGEVFRAEQACPCFMGLESASILKITIYFLIIFAIDLRNREEAVI
jgi:hypothetical protein